MRIVDLLNPQAVSLNSTATDKQNAIDKLIALHKTVGNISDEKLSKKKY